ncbi:triose-phosphate isomerase [Pseudogemmobacter faecipullorum]|uniref:Triosephosphate isomerase n=1 Tax=Pseudogemmobacter faecipullorum TaxID=2755041 RepID=A0ABS8CPT7_9RHOB|nr:triose-phosphate isomerase [Pseudogemmobacter faecipullorum]MCB5411411.1 triose-phosphate isomerase [Pseudogemmobacter faecipullorum]
MDGKTWVGTNWKMHKTFAEAKAFAEGLLASDKDHDRRIQRFIFPPALYVREIKELLKGTDVMVGTQNMHWADEGAFTGEISPVMLKDAGLDIIELGHSERREMFGETDEGVGLKVEAAIRHGLIPLICIGETLEDRNSGRASEVLATQVRAALAKLTAEQMQTTILLAYEPVWAIGVNGIPASAEYADARQAEIIAVAQEVTGRRLPCLYGGSVNPGNAEELIRCPHIDGLFVGRSAWQVEGYLGIMAQVSAHI